MATATGARRSGHPGRAAAARIWIDPASPRIVPSGPSGSHQWLTGAMFQVDPKPQHMVLALNRLVSVEGPRCHVCGVFYNPPALSADSPCPGPPPEPDSTAPSDDLEGHLL